ncbi:MAG: hypothetical protein AB7E51_05240 [Pseudodesulfovibrio sp.]|jgi:hypothetical protein|uniref:hypothetical protein n=1 Tax=Pseudodesulfovibrio sp. TaxID=2035812 RepID=UPI003D14BA92
MRRILFALCATLVMTLSATAAKASEYTDMDICMGRQLLARVLCKDPMEINFVAKVKDSIYLFSVFYARQEARFVVGISSDTVRIQGKEFLKLTRTISYTFDKTSKCGVANYSNSECINREPVVCCSEKTEEEKMDQKFWDRPIPDLLEEDLRKALDSLPPEDAPPSPDRNDDQGGDGQDGTGQDGNARQNDVMFN